jgi:hypothetical protein
MLGMSEALSLVGHRRENFLLGLSPDGMEKE